MMAIRKTITVTESIASAAGVTHEEMLRKVAVVAVVQNGYAGRPFATDLSAHVQESRELGRLLGTLAVAAMAPHSIQSYGKAAVIGIAGEQEHGVALLTTVFGDAFRAAIGGGKAWISSVTKVGAPGAHIDVPLAFKDELYVRSHYDAMNLYLSDAPLPNEIAVIVCVANRGRLNHRVGGLSVDEVLGKDAQR